jgi:PAS domain S-box-containing protein
LDKNNPQETISKELLMDVFNKYLECSKIGFGVIFKGEIVYTNPIFSEIMVSGKKDSVINSLKDFLELVPNNLKNTIKEQITQFQKQRKKHIKKIYIPIGVGTDIKKQLELKLKPIKYENNYFITMTIEEMQNSSKSKEYKIDQKELEKKISIISSRFGTDGNIDDVIPFSLKDVCNLTNSDRAYIILFHGNNCKVKNRYDCFRQENKDQYVGLKEFKKTNFSWFLKKLKEEGEVFIPNLLSLPEEASREKQILKEKKIKSLLAYPIYINTNLSGFIAIEHTKVNKIWNDLEFALIRIVSKILGNIFEKENREKKFKKSEVEYKAIIENLNECYFEVDLKGNFTYFNKAVCQKLGYSKDELMGMNYSKILDEETEKRVLKFYNEIYESENPKLNEEYLVKRKDGEILTFQSSAYLSYDSEGKKTGFYGLARDITEKKKAIQLKEKFYDKLEQKVERRTKKLNETLEKQKRYQEEILKASNFKSEFLATMSHELRTPLNAIIGFTDLLLEGTFGDLNSEQQEYLIDIKTSAEHQFEMISNILDITKIESGKVTLDKKYFSLNTVIDQMKSTIKPMQEEKNLDFRIRGLDEFEDAQIYADPVRFKEILLNLLTNAIKFTETGKITLIIQEKFNRWIFKVRDTGIGIAREDFDKIFKEFKRVDSSYVRSTNGTGLGLSLTKRLVELHNGEISFNSVLGVGTTFKFHIPKKLNEPNII